MQIHPDIAIWTAELWTSTTKASQNAGISDIFGAGNQEFPWAITSRSIEVGWGRHVQHVGECIQRTESDRDFWELWLFNILTARHPQPTASDCLHLGKCRNSGGNWWDASHEARLWRRCMRCTAMTWYSENLEMLLLDLFKSSTCGRRWRQATRGVDLMYMIGWELRQFHMILNVFWWKRDACVQMCEQLFKLEILPRSLKKHLEGLCDQPTWMRCLVMNVVEIVELT